MTTGFGSEYQVVTSVLTCRVSREEQQHVTERLEYLTSAFMAGLDGFLSASIEKGTKGDAVLVVSRWQTQNHHAAMLKEPGVRECIRDLDIICHRVDTEVFETVRHFESELDAHVAHDAGLGASSNFRQVHASRFDDTTHL